jgi:hypothetical protein
MSERDLRLDTEDEAETALQFHNCYDPINGFGKLCAKCGKRFGEGAFIYHQCGPKRQSIMEEIAEKAASNHKFWR